MELNNLLLAVQNNDIEHICNALNDCWFEYSDKEDPIMSDTIGSLMDKLATCNLKMGFNQEMLYKTRKQSTEEFTALWQNNMAELHQVLKRCLDLNNQRARLMDEIDKKLAAALKGDIKPDDLVALQHKTY